MKVHKRKKKGKGNNGIVECKNNLHLETTRSTTTTSLLELAALGTDVGLLVLVGTETEVLDSLTGVLLATDQDSVGTGGARVASWSRVRHSPPAASIRARAVLVNRRAATESLGAQEHGCRQ